MKLETTYAATERQSWLQAIEWSTLNHRAERSNHHRQRAREAEEIPCDCIAQLEDGEIVGYASPLQVPLVVNDTTRHIGKRVTCVHGATVLWHEVRAEGQLKRFRVVARCGARTGSIECGACSTEHRALTEQCDQHRLCIRCRGRRASRMRSRFRVGRNAALRRFARERRGGRGASGVGGQYRERFLTLTFPDSGEPSKDVTALVAAWPDFIRGVRHWIARHHGINKKVAARCPFTRVIEVTPGKSIEHAKTGGHAHLHVWILAPYLPHAVLRVLWARALGDVACRRVPTRTIEECKLNPREEAELRALRINPARVPWPVVDVRAVHGDPGNELVKYLIKDLANEELIDPETFAGIYASLEGRRTAVAARGFWLPESACMCEACGVFGEMRLVLDRHPIEQLQDRLRAPP